MTFITYLTIYDGDKMPPFYLGSTSMKRYEAGYHGTVKSNKYKSVWKSELQEHPELFDTIVLTTHQTRQEALSQELQYHIQKDVIKNPEFINMAMAVPNGYFGMSKAGEKLCEAWCKAISNGRLNMTNEKKLRRAIAISQAYQNKSVEEKIAIGMKISQTKTNKSVEEKKILSQKLSIAQQKATVKKRGRKWYHHPETKLQVQRYPGEEPVGYILGRLALNNNSENHSKGGQISGRLKWWNNGIINKRADECPPGFIAGRIKWGKKCLISSLT